MKRIGWQDLLKEPYRVLFPLGMVFGCLGVGHWLLYATGLLPSASAFFHSSVQFGAYLYCFIVGFLWTAMPRMASARPASNAELISVLVLLGAQVFFLSRGRGQLAQVCFASLLVLLLVFVARRRPGAAGPPAAARPTEFLWVPVGAAFGLAGTAVLAAGSSVPLPPWLAGAGRVMAQQGFILSVVIGVGGFLAPRLMGRPYAGRRSPWLHLLAAALLGLSFVIEGAGAIRPAYALRAAVVTAELAWTAKWWKPPAANELYLRLLGVSLWCVVGGLWAAAAFPKYRLAMLHLVLIGGFSLMIFSVGTMVVLSHSGEAASLRKPLWVLKVIAIGVAGATLLRISADLWPARYFALLGASASFWLVAGVSWIAFSLPRVLRASPPGEFERIHREAKQRLIRDQAEPDRC